MRNDDSTYYLNKNETADFFIKDNDSYVASLTPPDLHARNVKTHREYLEKCVNSAMDFDSRSKSIINNAIVLSDKYLRGLDSPYIDNEKMNKIMWKIALSSCEEGLPHTRQDIIFLSPNVLKRSVPEIASILVHEKVHVYQRKFLQEFRDSLLANGYSIIGERREYPLARSNPDLDNLIYSDKDGNIMISLYKSDTPSSINDVVASSHGEHPFEEIAYVIGDKFV